LAVLVAGSAAGASEPDDPRAAERIRSRGRPVGPASAHRGRPSRETGVAGAGAGNPEETIADLRLHQQITDEVLLDAMIVDGVMSRLARERTESSSAHDFLENRHQRSVTTWNIAAVMVGSGMTIVGASLQFGNESLQDAGVVVTISGALAAAAFSVVALVEKNEDRPPYPIESSLLARILGRPPVPGSDYPEPVWRYLDRALPGEGASIRQRLVDKWIREGRIARATSPAAARRIHLLTLTRLAEKSREGRRPRRSRRHARRRRRPDRRDERRPAAPPARGEQQPVRRSHLFAWPAATPTSARPSTCARDERQLNATSKHGPSKP